MPAVIGHETAASRLGDKTTKNPRKEHVVLSVIWIRDCSNDIGTLVMRVPGRDGALAMRSGALTCTPSLGAAASGR